jgi:hypothetical protein
MEIYPASLEIAMSESGCEPLTVIGTSDGELSPSPSNPATPYPPSACSSTATPTSTLQIAKANNVADPNNVPVGTTLQLPVL